MPRMTKAREAAVRQRILDAGIAVFERHGFASASMTAIAGGRAFGRRAVYALREQGGVVLLSLRHACRGRGAGTREGDQRESGRPARAIDLAIDYVAQVAAGDTAEFRGAGANFLLHAWATADDNPALREMLLGRRVAASRTRPCSRRGRDRPGLPPDLDADGLGLAFTSLLDGLFLQRAEQGDSFTADDARRQARAVVDAIFRAGSDSPAMRPLKGHRDGARARRPQR